MHNAVVLVRGYSKSCFSVNKMASLQFTKFIVLLLENASILLTHLSLGAECVYGY